MIPSTSSSQKTLHVQRSNRRALGHRFTAEEDITILSLVEKHGKDWVVIAREMGTTERQCRERYRDYLDPSNNRGEWTAEEDLLLANLFTEFGPKWRLMKMYFPGRPCNQIKNRYNTHIKRNSELFPRLGSLPERREKKEMDQVDVEEANVDIFDDVDGNLDMLDSCLIDFL